MQEALEKPKEAQRFADISAQAVHDSRQDKHQLATAFDESEGALNEGLGFVHKLFSSTTTATSAMSIDTGDRTVHEQDFLLKALFLLQKIINEEDMEGNYELVTVGSS